MASSKTKPISIPQLVNPNQVQPGAMPIFSPQVINSHMAMLMVTGSSLAPTSNGNQMPAPYVVAESATANEIGQNGRYRQDVLMDFGDTAGHLAQRLRVVYVPLSLFSVITRRSRDLTSAQRITLPNGDFVFIQTNLGSY